MELNGAKPNFVIWPEAAICHLTKTSARKAIDVLMKDIKDWKEKRSAIKPLCEYKMKLPKCDLLYWFKCL